MVGDVTILIPTHNRHRYLKRALDYFLRFDVDVVICDSSEEPYVFSRPFPRISYLHFKGLGFEKKLLKALKGIKTEYVVLCGDDDFLVPEAMRLCVSFLKKNPDYSSARGHYVLFRYSKGKITYIPRYFEASGDILGKSAKERLVETFSPYMHLFYSVHRKKNLVDIFELIDSKIKNHNLVEYLIAIMTSIKGKSKVLPIFYSAREWLPDSGGATTDEIDKLTHDRYYKKEYHAFLDISIAEYCDKESVSKKEGSQMIKKVVRLLIKNSLEKKTLESKLSLFDRFVPGFLKKRLRFLYNRWLILRTIKVKGSPFFDKKGKKYLKKIEYMILKHSI